METQQVFDLIARFDDSSLTEIKLKDGDFSLQLRKAGAEPAVIYQQHQPTHQYPMPGSHAPAPSAPPAAAEQNSGRETAAPVESGLEVITSPIVGTFYRAAAPDSPPHVEEGDAVAAGKPLCIIEAMKVMNELEAEFDMEIVRILVENSAMVEFGTPLFEVRRA